MNAIMRNNTIISLSILSCTYTQTYIHIYISDWSLETWYCSLFGYFYPATKHYTGNCYWIFLVWQHYWQNVASFYVYVCVCDDMEIVNVRGSSFPSLNHDGCLSSRMEMSCEFMKDMFYSNASWFECFVCWVYGELLWVPHKRNWWSYQKWSQIE